MASGYASSGADQLIKNYNTYYADQLLRPILADQLLLALIPGASLQYTGISVVNILGVGLVG